MTDFSQSLNTLTSIEELVDGQTIIHRLHPGVKLALTFLYLVLVVSCPVYNPGLLAFLPSFISGWLWRNSLAGPSFKRSGHRPPLRAFCWGLLNLIFTDSVAVIAFLPITTGAISF